MPWPRQPVGLDGQGGRWRVLRCSTWGSEFSERKGTALWNSKMAPERVEAIASHLEDGCGVRKRARLVGASKDGVTSIGIRLGLHAYAVHGVRARGLRVREAQFEEKWAFVGKKQDKCDETDAEAGDQWDRTAIDAESRFVVSLAVGKRNAENLRDVVSDFAERSGGSPPP